MLTPEELKLTISTLKQRRVWLGKALEDADADQKTREEHLQSSAMQKLTKIASNIAASDPSPPSNTLTGKKPEELKVLVAEDNTESSELMVELLRDLGFREIDTATNGKEAFDKIKSAKEAYHIILCDWDMPELSGLEVHSKAKASNTLGGAHFMMVTAVSEATRIRQAIQQGISDYIVKPIDIEILQGKIKAALAGESTP